MPASFTVIEIKGSLGKQKLKLTYLYTAKSVRMRMRMRIVVKFLNHLLPQSYWSIMVLFTFGGFFSRTELLFLGAQWASSPSGRKVIFHQDYGFMIR